MAKHRVHRARTARIVVGLAAAMTVGAAASALAGPIPQGLFMEVGAGGASADNFGDPVLPPFTRVRGHAVDDNIGGDGASVVPGVFPPGTVFPPGEFSAHGEIDADLGKFSLAAFAAEPNGGAGVYGELRDVLTLFGDVTMDIDIDASIMGFAEPVDLGTWLAGVTFGVFGVTPPDDCTDPDGCPDQPFFTFEYGFLEGVPGVSWRTSTGLSGFGSGVDLSLSLPLDAPLGELNLLVTMHAFAGCNDAATDCLADADAFDTMYLGLSGAFTSANGYGYVGFASPPPPPAVPEPAIGILLLIGACAATCARVRNRR